MKALTVDDLEHLQAALQHASDEVAGHLETIRRQSAALGKARREDPDKKLREHADWDRGHRLFRVWQRATGHTRSKWTTDRFKAILPYLRVYEDELIGRAIEGIAYDPYETPRRNGTRQKHDGWDLLLKSADKLEEFANRAPLNWKDNLMEHAEEAGSRS